MNALALALTGLILGVALGGLVVFAWRRSRENALATQIGTLTAQLHTQETLARERDATLKQAEERLAASFGRLASQSLATNSENFLRLAEERLGRQQERAKADLTEREKAVADLIKPIQDAIDKTERQIGEIEKARQESFGSIRSQLAAMTENQQALQAETRNLVNALRRPQVRGQWGEMTLRRVVELAGMVEHCDFLEQATVDTGEGLLRPDMIIRLPERGEIIVDAKTPLDAYLDATEAVTEQDRRQAMQRHARKVMDHVRALAAKGYWSQFAASPEFVILFMPGEQFLAAALGENPSLLEEALRHRVLLATPTSLVALLKAIAYGWRELSLAHNAEEVRKLAEELYERLGPFAGHLARLGRQLDSSVKAFNDSVGSLERKVLPSARRLTELGIRVREEIESPAVIDASPRPLTTSEDRDNAGPPSAEDNSMPKDTTLAH
jgi:DNA recombination protein RmuC